MNDKSIGIIEFRSIAMGMLAADFMLKRSLIHVVLSTVLCPGKYILMISGDVSSVEQAIEEGIRQGGEFTISHIVIPSVHPNVFPALTGTVDVVKQGALGLVETIDIAGSILAADLMAKAADVELMEVRVARGMGGKAFVLVTGDNAAVKAAVASSLEGLKDQGTILATSVISSPHRDLSI